MACFVDTNILLYAISTDPKESLKNSIAIQILKRPDCVLSVQVLQEFYVQATRSSRVDALDHDLAVGFIKAWQRFKIIDNTTQIMTAALEIKAKFKLSYWDSVIIAAAAEANCRTLFTEDLNHGQVVLGVQSTNPFL